MKMEIKYIPDLSNCVEALAKQDYNRTVKKMLESKEETRPLEKRLQIIKEFLESNDFGKLRSWYEPYLVEEKKVVFILKEGLNSVRYEVEIL